MVTANQAAYFKSQHQIAREYHCPVAILNMKNLINVKDCFQGYSKDQGLSKGPPVVRGCLLSMYETR